MSALFDTFIEPFLTRLGVYTPPDPTYGRYLLETSPYETALEATSTSDAPLRVTSRRVFLEKDRDGRPSQRRGEDVQLVSSELKGEEGREWIYYKMWEKGTGTGNDCDAVMLHGINDYGGKWAPHVSGLLAQGFRVIAPDLPSHGRSTGLHVYLTSPEQLTEALDAVLDDAAGLSDVRRKVFLVGSSMGGGLALTYCARHRNRSRVDGVFCIAPLIGVAPETLPSPLIQLTARLVRFFAGRLPLAPAVKGNVSDDPRVEEEFFADPRGYHGHLRVSTGLVLLESLTLFKGSVVEEFKTPFRLVHGDHDRATSYHHSVEFYETAGSEDKEMKVYEGYEHVMLKVGVDEEDDEKRQRVLKDMETWLLRRC